MRQFKRSHMQPSNFYGRFSRLQSRRDRGFLENSGEVSHIAMMELKPKGRRYWILRDMFVRLGQLAIVKG